MIRIVLLLVAVLPALGQVAEGVAWGQAADGVRLGVGLGADETVRLVFQNTRATERDLLLGGRTGIGPIYSMEFTATGPDGKACQVFLGGVAGVVEPIVALLTADAAKWSRSTQAWVGRAVSGDFVLARVAP
jgi:hypothetical protein